MCPGDPLLQQGRRRDAGPYKREGPAAVQWGPWEGPPQCWGAPEETGGGGERHDSPTEPTGGIYLSRNLSALVECMDLNWMLSLFCIVWTKTNF